MLYHPTVYKTSMCDSWNCSRYYCPFAHSVDELVSKPANSISNSIYDHSLEAPGGAEDIRLRQLNFEDYWEDNDFDESSVVGPNGSPVSSSHHGSGSGSDFNELMSLQMRRVVHRNGSGGTSGSVITTTNLESNRIAPSCLQAVANVMTGVNNPDPGWVTLTQGLRVELVVRAVSPLTNSELCLGTARAPWETGAASNGGIGGQNNRRGQQQASMVVKIICVEEATDPELVSLMSQLQAIARSDHKNILSIKKVHMSRFPGGAALSISYERCSTSLYTTVAEGYRVRAGFGAHPRGLAGRMNPGRSFTPTSATVGKVAELLSAIQRFHSLGHSHCRICPSNIFIDADANLKLGDCDSKFGISRPAIDPFLTEPVAAWTAPEAAELLANGARDKIDWKKADVFSAGLCVFFALTGQHAFGTFADEERTAAAGAAANARQFAQGSLFVEGRDALLSNMHSCNMVNQHLLYSNPLSLDLILRLMISRTEVSELLTHPMFWDFYSIARFVTRLPMDEGGEACSSGGQIVRLFCETCPVPWIGAVAMEDWKLVGASPMDFKDNVLDLLRAVRAVLSRHKASGCGFCNSSDGDESVDQHAAVTSFVSRMVARFPALIVRAWDAGRIAAVVSVEEYLKKHKETFARNHLSWMNHFPRPMAQPDGRSLILPSHGFVREYYAAVAAVVEPPSSADDFELVLGPDESAEIMAAIVAQAAAAVAAEQTHLLSLGSPALKPTVGTVDPGILSSMVKSFGAMMRSDMLPPGVPRAFVMSLIEAAGSQLSTAVSKSPNPSPQASPASGVYYSTVMKPATHLPSGSTTAVSSPAFTPVLLPTSAIPERDSPKGRRMSSHDGWEYAVACPPNMLNLPVHAGILPLDGDDDESPPPGFQTVWQSMADDGL